MGAAHEELQQSRIRIDSLSAQLSQLQKQVMPHLTPSSNSLGRTWGGGPEGRRVQDRTCLQDPRLSKKPRVWSQMTCLLFQDFLLSKLKDLPSQSLGFPL